MTDSRGNEKAEFKGLRRASFARALHVPAIGRRKHVEIVEHANRNAFPSRNNVEKEPQRGPSPNPVTVSIAARGAEHNDGDEGAEIPDIPLRRSHVKRVSADYSGSSLGTLERMLTTGGTPDASNGHLFGPINPNAIMSSGGEKRGADEACDALEPLAEEDVEPGSFDLVVPATNLTVYNLERRSELLFSVDHLRIIFGDPVFLQRFLNFITIYRPQSVPLLRYYLEALKAIRALEWINSIISGPLRIDGYDFASKGPLEPTTNKSLLQKAEAACESLARDELPAYVTHVDVSGLAKDCSGLESLRRLVDKDEEGKQVPGTQDNDGDAVSRVDSGTDVETAPPVGIPSARDAELGDKEHFRLLCEILNRQELETVRRYGGRMHRSQQEQIQHESSSNWAKGRVIIHDNESSPPRTPRRQNNSEVHDFTGNIAISPRATSPPLTAAPAAQIPTIPTTLHGPRVPTIYEHFLVVRPYPSLKILFASPSLRVPGILQSHLMGRIGGSKRIHEELEQAFALGQGVTAKVRWISGGARSDSNSNSGSNSIENGGKEGRPRWIHCTPLIGSNGSVGVWMVVVVDEDADGSGSGSGGRLRRDAPTVSGPRARGDRRKNHDSLLALDTMSLNDFAAMNSLPQDEDLRQHVRHMYEETRRRERLAGADGWDRKWPESRDGDRETIRVKDGAASGSGSWRGRVEELRKVAYSRSRSSSPFTLKIDD
ncbi:putative hisactophilin c49s mutant phototropin phy3 fusion protein [Diaporthe ampelina]|uniref:Putative hisactophilin c49s mutant phototropin phy3 fusion protein n=1 Tax=Diaporthe ampelina TaxID=1214573 RepID=A0A0G2F8Y6_9PEZI|nr:putative hisactophilin c49s mutant phototropin phy3 fusion protein [Diaporthe ampelina]